VVMFILSLPEPKKVVFGVMSVCLCVCVCVCVCAPVCVSLSGYTPAAGRIVGPCYVVGPYTRADNVKFWEMTF